MKRLTRQPRKYWLAYAGHALQGFLVGLFCPMFWGAFLYTHYQRSEFEAYWKRNEAGEYLAGDMVSRDIADYLAGYYVGSSVTIVLLILAIFVKPEWLFG